MSFDAGSPRPPRMIEDDDRPGPPPLMSEPRSKGKRLTLAIALAVLAGFGGVVWYAYDQGRKIGSEGAAPVIKADGSPTKVRPEQPGGMSVPHQDKLVLQDLAAGKNAETPGGSARVERLLPPPEAPLPKPEPLPPEPVAEAPRTIAPAPAPQSPPQTLPPGIPPARVTAPPPAVETPASAPQAPVAPAPAPSTPAPAAQPAPPAARPAPTGSAETPARTAASGNFNIQIGALRSEDAARTEWTRVQNANRALLADLSPTYQRVSTDKGVFFRVQGGPLTEDRAREVCAGLKAKGQACLVVKR